MKASSPHYQTVKSHIIDGIRSGRWSAGERIPSETALAREFGLSRMTANRAVRELAADGILERVQGKGTFVVEAQPLTSVLQIRSIADEIKARGNNYSARVVSVRLVVVTSSIQQRMWLPVGSQVASSTVIHFENEIPLQVEQRLVNPVLAPDYTSQDFSATTPHDYLTSLAPFSRGEHTIEACWPESRMLRWLQLDSGEPCLRIHRTTWVGSTVASNAILTHAGSRYQLRTSLTSAGGTNDIRPASR